MTRFRYTGSSQIRTNIKVMSNGDGDITQPIWGCTAARHMHCTIGHLFCRLVLLFELPGRRLTNHVSFLG